MFRSSHCSILVLGHFWRRSYKNTKISRIFVYILQGKMGKTEKNRKENHSTKVTKIPKTKRRKYGMNETFINIFINTLSLYQLEKRKKNYTQWWPYVVSIQKIILGKNNIYTIKNCYFKPFWFLIKNVLLRREHVNKVGKLINPHL